MTDIDKQIYEIWQSSMPARIKRDKLAKLISEQTTLARIDEHDAVVEASCELSDSAFHVWSENRIAKLNSITKEKESSE